MSNDLAKIDSEMIAVLENSLYPGASPASISLVLSYCKSASLDPMQKPVHIVPMWDSKTSRMRDVIMPGIGLYRTNAARTGQYAGVSEPEFGADVTKSIGGAEITFPSWCKVSVRRLLANGAIAEFSATERWEENYATKGGKEKSIAPNAMWSRRPYAQLAKCAEAQALRKAFPEVGAQPTADEMEGKALDDSYAVDNRTGEITNRKVTPQSALASNISEGYDEYEQAHLPMLQAAANSGTQSLQAAFKALPSSQHKAALWTKHSAELKDAASSADFVGEIEDAEVVE